MKVKTLQEMKDLADNGVAQILTVKKAQELKGKHIQVLYFGYAGQDDTDNFVVGNLILNEKRNKQLLFALDGRNTYIYRYDEVMCCTDDDRAVLYVEI